MANKNPFSELYKEYDVCVITAANDYQAQGYQKQLQWRKDKGKYSEFFVFADPQGKRIGSGGSTIYVLYGIRNYFCENNHENYQSPHEPFKGKRILILHSGGDSRRLPAYSAVGKIFIPLPTSLSMDGFVTLFDILFFNLMQLPSLDDGQVVVASGDVLLSFDASKVTCSDSGVTGLAYPGPVEVASNHGVYIVPQTPSGENLREVVDFLQKPTYDELKKCNGLDTANRAFIDTGVMNFGVDAIKVLMRASGISLEDGKVVVGKNSLCEDFINANVQLQPFVSSRPNPGPKSGCPPFQKSVDSVDIQRENMEFNQQTILVTGGAGFIGSHLVERLLHEGQRVICLDNFDLFYARKIKRTNLQMALRNSNFTLVEGDIRDAECLNPLFEQYPIEKFVHLAARAGVRASIENPQLYEDVNIKGTLNLLEVCKDLPIKQFIFASSSSVYGVNGKVPFSEDDKIEMPISPYAASKRAGELFCYTYHHLYNIPITCLRFFTVYGSRQRPEMAIHKFTRLIDEGEEITMFGDGTSRRDYTYISDIIDGIMGALDKPFVFEIFNLGESQTVELRYLISLIEQNLDKTAKIKRLPEQPGDVPMTFADISKSQKLLNYNPKVKIEEGVEKFVDWYKRVGKSTYQS